ncbi:MAG: hypothetical protein RL385_5232 [Pseudomonadota bacterium]|jgi:hypothetical protein
MLRDGRLQDRRLVALGAQPIRRTRSTEQLESVVNSEHFVVGAGAPAGST